LSYIGFGGSGKQVRDFLHITDLCELIAEQLRNIEQWDGWVGNVSGGIENSASLLELTELCQEVTGRTIRIGRDPATRAGDVRIFIGDCTRLFRKTPWRPRRNLSDIVRDTSSWITENQASLRTL
jgi:CDP-paratose 2-epimerase